MTTMRETYTTEILPPYQITSEQYHLTELDCSEISCTNKASHYQVFRIAGLQFLVLFCKDHIKPVEAWFKE